MLYAKPQLLTDSFHYPKRSTKKKQKSVARAKPSRKPKAPKDPKPKRAPLTSEARKERDRTRSKRRFEDAKSLGLCRDCREPALEGQTRCEKCAERHRARRREDDSRRRAVAKLSEERPTQEYGRPAKSRRSEQEEACLSSEQRKRERRKAAGLCKNCAEPSKPGRSRCEGCSEKQRVQEREARARKKAERQQANANQ